MAESLYKDTDPLGVEHLKNTSKAPLAAAMRFVSRLEVVRPTDEETLRLKAEVQLRRGASTGARSGSAAPCRGGQSHALIHAPL